jgi:anthranilate phosphoribosyltransferase
MNQSDFKLLIGKIASGEHLSRAEVQHAFDVMMSGNATPAQIGAFLMGLRIRGETIEEITGAAELMRSKMTPVKAPAGAIDIVGTGGDEHGTYNISTCATLVAAGAGAKIAKHGNRAASSKSGASDVLAALGVKLDISPETVSECIETAGVGFIWAALHHPAMKHVGPTRSELGIRTIFNILGPICNPAGVKRQILGVYSRDLVEPIAHVLENLGSDHVWVVHGHDGMDELTTTGRTHVAELKNGTVRVFDVEPADVGLPTAAIRDLVGADPEHNAKAILAVLAGEKGPYRDIVLLNAGAALVVSELAATLADGIEKAARSIDTGAAAAALEKLIEVSNFA